MLARAYTSFVVPGIDKTAPPISLPFAYCHANESADADALTI